MTAPGAPAGPREVLFDRSEGLAQVEAPRSRVPFLQKLLHWLHPELRFGSERPGRKHTSSRYNYLMQPNY
jgi:hypothetical protein